MTTAGGAIDGSQNAAHAAKPASRCSRSVRSTVRVAATAPLHPVARRRDVRSIRETDERRFDTDDKALRWR
jgi:hypothetical protein